MKLAQRLTILLLALGLFFGTTLRPAFAQEPDPKFDAKFQAAKALEADQPVKAYDEYARVARENDKVPDLAGEALLRSALFASSSGYGRTEDLKSEGDHKAHDAYKQLLQRYAETPAGRYVIDHQLKEDLEKRIDQRNSHSFNYKIVDSLVALTGRIPAFSYWFALLLIAIIVKAITFPLTLKMYKSQREMQRLQPHLQALKEQYKDDSATLNQKTMDLFKEHGVNPFASCLPLFIQMPFLIWVYNTIRQYEFHFSNGKFLWIGSSMAHQFPSFIGGNLGQFDIPLLCLYAASNYITMKLTPTTDPQAAQTQKTTAVMMTVMMFWMFLTYRWSAAFIFYWLMLNLISAWQQYTYIYKPNQNNGGGTSGGAGEVIIERAPRPATPVPGEAMRPRPKRKTR